MSESKQKQSLISFQKEKDNLPQAHIILPPTVWCTYTSYRKKVDTCYGVYFPSRKDVMHIIDVVSKEMDRLQIKDANKKELVKQSLGIDEFVRFCIRDANDYTIQPFLEEVDGLSKIMTPKGLAYCFDEINDIHNQQLKFTPAITDQELTELIENKLLFLQALSNCSEQEQITFRRTLKKIYDMLKLCPTSSLLSEL